MFKGKKLPVFSPEVLLASAYQMNGKVKEAKKELQIGIYENIIGLFGIFLTYLSICVDDVEQFEKICHRALGLIELFKVRELHPTVTMNCYYTAAHGYAIYENLNKSLVKQIY